MTTELVTFDCAETLVAVDWNPGQFAVDCAKEAGLSLDEQVARETYDRMLGTRWLEYRQINCTRDHEACDLFWREMTRDWLNRSGAGEAHLESVLEAAERLMYGPGSRVFRLFEDVVPVLDALDARGVPAAVLSNWDYSLHKVLRSLGVYDRFRFVFASLEEGIEKPEPEFFNRLLSACGAKPAAVLHVGDDPIADIQGARGVGMRALLLDRSRSAREGNIIPNLAHVLDDL